MKWSLLRLREAPVSQRRPEPARSRRPHAPAEPPPSTQLPHRGLALRALRQLARGHYLVVAGESALAVCLAGVPDIVHLAQELIGRGLVQRVEVQECGAACYELSAAGHDTLQRGEQWWHEMSPFERLVVELTG